jgi:hypothetical protein
MASSSRALVRPQPQGSKRNWHAQALTISSHCTLSHRQMVQKGAIMIGPLDVIRVLNEAEVGFVLMGTYGIAGWRQQPRATQDVDVLVQKKDHRKAVAAITRAFPGLKGQDSPVVTRFTDPETGEVVIDLMKPGQDLYKLVFKNALWVEKSHRVPNLEMALTSKFAAMISPNRSYDKKLVDGGDFVNMVKKNFKAIDRKKLRRLAEKVYRGGGESIIKMIDDLQAGRRIEF